MNFGVGVEIFIIVVSLIIFCLIGVLIFMSAWKREITLYCV